MPTPSCSVSRGQAGASQAVKHSGRDDAYRVAKQSVKRKLGEARPAYRARLLAAVKQRAMETNGLEAEEEKGSSEQPAEREGLFHVIKQSLKRNLGESRSDYRTRLLTIVKRRAKEEKCQGAKGRKGSESQ